MIQAPRLSLRDELKQFRDFALKGSVVDLAFAVIIGAAFGKIVDSLVKDVIMPIIGVFGSADFSNYFLPLNHAVTATNLADAQKQGPVLAWGSFATYVVNFLIVALVLFGIVRMISVLRPPRAAGRTAHPRGSHDAGSAAGRDPRPARPAQPGRLTNAARRRGDARARTAGTCGFAQTGGPVQKLGLSLRSEALVPQPIAQPNGGSHP